MYRIAVAKDAAVEEEKEHTTIGRLKNKGYEAFVPVEEYDRCYFLQ